MRVVVTGASGNVGTGVLRRLGARVPEAEVIGLCRRPPTLDPPFDRVSWREIDLTSLLAGEELRRAFAGQLAGLVGARPLPVPGAILRAVVTALFRAHVLAVSPGWFDVATRTPVMDTARARTVLGWQPAHSSEQAARELLDAWLKAAPGTTPALRD